MIAHLEVFSMGLIDKEQLKPHFGSFYSPLYNDEQLGEVVEKGEQAQTALIYKHSYDGVGQTDRVRIKSLKEFEHFRDIELPYIFSDTFNNYEFKNRNCVSFGLFKFAGKKRTKTDVDLRVSNLAFRTDFRLRWLD